MTVKVFDFNDCNGDVPAKQWDNGGGWVACTAKVDETVYVGRNAQVSGNARVYGNAQVYCDERVEKTPINIIGLDYPITITETHLFAGCQGHEFDTWRKLSEGDIEKMDGERATKFYPVLIQILDTFVS
jgi:hypothetical protein